MLEALKNEKNLAFLPQLNFSLLEKLITSGAITSDQLQIAKIENEKTGRPLDALLVELGFISDQLMVDIQSKHKGYVNFNPQKTLLDISLLKRLSQDKATTFKVLPLFLTKGVMHVAVCDPEDIRLFDYLTQCYENITDFKIYIATPAVLLETIDRYYGQEFPLENLLKSFNMSQTSSNTIENVGVQFLQAILMDAVKQKASDIHFEPEEKFIRLRYRIDGVLKQIHAFHHNLWPSLTVRLKILSHLNIAESRMPQDGRFNLNVLGREVDLRVSTLPTHYGENIVIRILDKLYSLKSLEDLGLNEDQCEKVKNLLAHPEGIIIVTGPTGSGKTTTLYSMLQYLSMTSLNIMTLEEPIEYKLPCYSANRN
ncbi:MAG: GspE/PulE family protein [Janthinobacterium lividum]